MSNVHTFTSQILAQNFIKKLVRQGLEPGSDFSTKTLSDGKYQITIHAKFGLFGA